MEKITEKELVERFGTDKQKELYLKKGKLVGDLKRGVIKRAERCCVITPLEHKIYKLTAIKKERYINNSVKTYNDVYDSLLPIMMKTFCSESLFMDWRLIATKINIVDKRLFLWSRNSIIISEVSDKHIDDVYLFFGTVRKFVKYYIERSFEYLLKDNFISCELEGDSMKINVINNPYEDANINECRSNVVKAISQKIYNATSKDWKPYVDILLCNTLRGKSLSIKERIDKLIPTNMLNEEYLFLNTLDKDKKNNLNVDRNTPEYFAWKESVLKRDNYTCQCCGFTENLQAHHIENYADNENLRTDIDNGITLCEGCHAVYSMGSFHNIFGTRHNTRKQLELYLSKYGKIRKAIQDILKEDM